MNHRRPERVGQPFDHLALSVQCAREAIERPAVHRVVRQIGPIHPLGIGVARRLEEDRSRDPDHRTGRVPGLARAVADARHQRIGHARLESRIARTPFREMGESA